MWSKGAVVIVRHGDEDMGNAIKDAVGTKMVPIDEVKKLEEDVKELERDNFFLRKRSSEAIMADILSAEIKYGRNFVPPKWAKKIWEWNAFLIYHFSMFVDKYLVLR